MKAFLRCGIAEHAMQAFFDNQTRNGVIGGWSPGVLEFCLCSEVEVVIPISPAKFKPI